MTRSKFRLEPLLRIRRFKEDEAKRVLAERLREIRRAEERKAGLHQHLLEAGATMRSLVLAGRIVPQEAARQRGYIGSLQARRLAVVAELEALQQDLVADRAALAEATKRRKILEKLKDRQQQRMIREQNLAEQRSSDELAVLQFVRGRQV
jgi:flagellar FliJ protein